MANKYWKCENCGSYNLIIEHHCTTCNHEISREEYLNASENVSRVKDFKSTYKIKKPKYIIMLNKFTKLLLLISIICLISSFIMYLFNGKYFGIIEVFTGFFNRIRSLIVNIFNYFINFTYGNNMIVKLFRMLLRNLLNFFNIIISNITGIFK